MFATRKRKIDTKNIFDYSMRVCVFVYVWILNVLSYFQYYPTTKKLKKRFSRYICVHKVACNQHTTLNYNNNNNINTKSPEENVKERKNEG